jgi:RNA polymerase sigma-70 factor, ECF subfamily
MPVADEQTLMDRCRKGDEGAFRALVEQHMQHVYDLAYSFVHHHDDADDLTQETFVKAYRSLSSFRGDAALGTWLYRIVTNLAMDRLRQQRRDAPRSVPLDETIAGTVLEDSDPGVSADLRLHIERALYQLPTLQRAVVILRHMDGLSTKQVSSILQCSEGTVKTHLHRGLKRMQKLLKHVHGVTA